MVGITGPPGAGKSTLTSALVEELRRRGRTVGVLAVDPSSPVTGGAILGDRVRMLSHVSDEGVYVRSVASRGRVGGLAWASAHLVDVLDAAGFDVVVIETVGAGQAEVDVASLADHTVVVVAPGAGDDVQAMKAGILEVADVLVVNKADLAGAETTRRDLLGMLALADGPSVPVVSTIAATGEGVSELVDLLPDAPLGVSAVRRRTRAAVRGAAEEAMRRALSDETALEPLLEQVLDGETTPEDAARAWLASTLDGQGGRTR